MTRTDLLKRVKQRPFAPFRLVLSEGSTYEMLHPDQAIVTRDSAVIGLLGAHEQDFYETTVLVDLFHIVSLEPLQTKPPAGGDGQH